MPTTPPLLFPDHLSIEWNHKESHDKLQDMEDTVDSVDLYKDMDITPHTHEDILSDSSDQETPALHVDESNTEESFNIIQNQIQHFSIEYMTMNRDLQNKRQEFIHKIQEHLDYLTTRDHKVYQQWCILSDLVRKTTTDYIDPSHVTKEKQ
ncbi:hypothetical protein BDB01DRAFT_852040 [Pilobolus umbonatus]|nr:hypothetical protein BDB01DRAFT_852040 [Pilobolus umbonatus]